jgi:hypothetical protein
LLTFFSRSLCDKINFSEKLKMTIAPKRSVLAQIRADF